MDTIAQRFLADIELFLAAAAIDPTTLGKQALGDPSFVFDLKKGRSPSARTMDKVRQWMRQRQTPAAAPVESRPPMDKPLDRLTHLERLEAESIHIIREVAAECEKPVMLYSIGKDSAVMLHLAKIGRAHV